MKYLLFISFTISTFVNATPGFLAPRQEECISGNKVCGIGCIPESYTCCREGSGGSGGCAPGYECGVADNGVGGCCPVGETCTGGAPLPSTYDQSDFAPTADPTTAIDDPTAATADVEPTKTTKPDTGGNKPPGGTKEDEATNNDNAGASNRLDSTVSYLLVGAMALLI